MGKYCVNQSHLLQNFFFFRYIQNILSFVCCTGVCGIAVFRYNNGDDPKYDTLKFTILNVTLNDVQCIHLKSLELYNNKGRIYLFSSLV